MMRTRNRRRTTVLPPASGPRQARHLAATALVLVFLLPSCGGKDQNENRIKPIHATLTIDPFPGTPDPAIYLEKGTTTGDLVTVNVKLHTTSTLNFDSLNLEFHFDPLLVQVGDTFEPNPALLGDCSSGLACQPFCLNNGSTANSTGTLLLGISRNPDASCLSASVSADTTLLTLGFIAATTIDPPGSRIELIDGSGHGDCEILQYGAGGSPIDLGVRCVDGNATMTAAR